MLVHPVVRKHQGFEATFEIFLGEDEPLGLQDVVLDVREHLPEVTRNERLAERDVVPLEERPAEHADPLRLNVVFLSD